LNYAVCTPNNTIHNIPRSKAMMLHLSLEDEVSANLVGGASGVDLVQLLSVESETEGSLNTGTEGLGVAESKDTMVVDLGLDEASSVQESLGTNLKADTLSSSLGVVDSLGTSLDISADTVVVAGSESAQVSETVEGDGVFGSAEANGSGVASDLALSDVVGSLTTEQEAVTANDSISSEGRALEDIKESAGVETGLFVDGREQSSLLAAVREERSAQVELEALGKVVLRLYLGAEGVGSGPRLGEDDTVSLVGVLCLDIARDEVALGILGAGDLEGDVGRGGGLDLERSAVEVEVPAQQVVGGLAEILPGWGNRLRERHGGE